MKLVRSIRIADGRVYDQDKVFFSHEEKDFRSFGRKLYKYLAVSYAKFYKMSPLCQLAFLASEVLLREHNTENLDPEMVSLVLANSSSSLHSDALYRESMESKPSPALFVYTLPNITIGEICIRNGFRGEGMFFIQESFDKGFIFDQAEALISSGRTDLCVAGWAEMGLNGAYLASFFLLE